MQLDDRAAKKGSTTADEAGTTPKDHKQKAGRAKKDSEKISTIGSKCSLQRDY
jgi:hypothetical protein